MENKNGIIYDTIASKTSVQLPENISVVVTRNEFETLKDAFNTLLNYVETNLKPTVEDFQTSKAAMNRHVYTTAFYQEFPGIIDLHLDRENNELYARRKHKHAQDDITDFAHTHPIQEITSLNDKLNLLARKLVCNADQFIPVSDYSGGSSAFELDFSTVDIYNIGLDIDCNLSVAWIAEGATGFVYVNTINKCSLTYGGTKLISAEDDGGVYRIEFQNNGIQTYCVGVMAILA